MVKSNRIGSALLAALLPVAAVAGSGTPATAARASAASTWAASQWLSATAVGSLTGTKLADVRSIIGASSGTAATLTGAGVGVALIDTGLAPVPGLPAAQVVNGPDLSFESQAPALRYLDTYGHGTHMAGIIVGNDTATGTKGLAPKVKLTSLKVGTANGAVDVTQVMAAVDWVVENRNQDPTHPIRVLNLSYASGGNPDSWDDPLQYAVEKAWQAGIVVVVATGNNGSRTQMSNPAKDKYILSVGATLSKGTLSKTDDELAPFTNLGGSYRQVDVLAPGQSILSLRDPGSYIDSTYPLARSGTLFRGSGTSQAAAVVSSSVALLLQNRPSLTPDQVKDAIVSTATPISVGTGKTYGLRQLNLAGALAKIPTYTKQYHWVDSNGYGDLDDSRGSSRVVSNGVSLSGNQTPFGEFQDLTWKHRVDNTDTWRGGTWMGYRLAADGWTGTSFASKTWGPATWTSRPWSGATTWTDPSWTGRFWAGSGWQGGTTWIARFWASDDWATSNWS